MEESDSAPEIRSNSLSHQQVVVASGRGLRPHAASGVEQACPFCPGNESLTPPSRLELTEGRGSRVWFVRVVENLFPIAGPGHGRSPAVKQGPFLSADAVGAHEVVIETPHHGQEIAAREAEQLLLTLQAWQARLKALTATGEIRYVVIFKNKGLEAGTSLEHPHSQIVGLSVVPRAVQRDVQAARRYFDRSGHCLICEDAQAERRAAARVIFDEAGFIAYVPFAASFAGQARLVPLDHYPSFAAASQTTLAAMSRCLRRLLVSLDAAFTQPAFNLILTTAPKSWGKDPALHWYLELIPRLAREGGFELATGMQINTLSPEAAARRYLSKHSEY